MSELVERVMRELMLADPTLIDAPSIARRVINTMRAPTQKMINAGEREADINSYEAEKAYRAMIGEALE